MSSEPEYQQPKFATKKKAEKTYDVDGRDINVVGNSICMNGFEYLHFEGELNEQRVSDLVRGYESGRRAGIDRGREWTKAEIKSWLGI